MSAKLDPHYRMIGQLALDSVARKYGKQWLSCFNADVARALVTAAVYHDTVQGVTSADVTATDLQEHGRRALNAALRLAGLDD